MLVPFLFFRANISTFWQWFDNTQPLQIQEFASSRGALIDASRPTETLRSHIQCSSVLPGLSPELLCVASVRVGIRADRGRNFLYRIGTGTDSARGRHD